MNLGGGCNDKDGEEVRSSAHLDLHIVSATWVFSSSSSSSPPFLFLSKKKKCQEENSEREKIIIIIIIQTRTYI
jgi:hypothetical protein